MPVWRRSGLGFGNFCHHGDHAAGHGVHIHFRHILCARRHDIQPPDQFAILLVQFGVLNVAARRVSQRRLFRLRARDLGLRLQSRLFPLHGRATRQENYADSRRQKSGQDGSLLFFRSAHGLEFKSLSAWSA